MKRTNLKNPCQIPDKRDTRENDSNNNSNDNDKKIKQLKKTILKAKQIK